MKDSFDREITYARLSVTDRCNLRCQYCMPADGIQKTCHSAILSLEQLATIAATLKSLGITKLRITGGEPLLRKGIDVLFNSLRALNFGTLALTTNGIYLPQNINMLTASGVNAINISLDSLNPQKYAAITRGGELADALYGIECAQKHCNNVKINVVYIKDFNDSEVADFITFGRQTGIPIRFIELMPFNNQSKFFTDHYISALSILQDYPRAIPVGGAPNCAAAAHSASVYYNIDGAKIGIIAPISHKFCNNCNRLRVTAKGEIFNCLHSQQSFSLLPYLQDATALSAFIADCVKKKPFSHRINDGIISNNIIGKIGG